MISSASLAKAPEVIHTSWDEQAASSRNREGSTLQRSSKKHMLVIGDRPGRDTRYGQRPGVTGNTGQQKRRRYREECSSLGRRLQAVAALVPDCHQRAGRPHVAVHSPGTRRTWAWRIRTIAAEAPNIWSS
jgi:hypothetical protein